MIGKALENIRGLKRFLSTMEDRRPHWSEYIHKDEGGSLRNRPFKNLGRIIETIPKKSSLKRGLNRGCREKTEADKTEQEIFLEAMKDVRPLENRTSGHSPRQTKEHTMEAKVMTESMDISRGIRELAALIRGERPLPVEKIPEYMDGPVFNMDRSLVRKLRKGQFAIHAYCELHGLRTDEALQVMDGFMSDALMNNRRAIAFIHGRGKSSAGEPVLKGLVKDFLNRGRFRRYVLAYSSAPSWDGGPGVTYVLLRKRPVKKTKGKR